MSFLSKLGLGRKKNLSTGTFGENKEEIEKAENRKDIFIKISVSIIFLGIIIFLYPRNIIQEISYQLNEPWKSEDLNAPFDFPILKTDAEIEAEMEEIRSETPPVFHLDANVSEMIAVRMDSVLQRLDPVLGNYADWRISQYEEDTSQARSDSSRYVQSRINADLPFDEEITDFLLENYADIKLEEHRTGTSIRRTFIGVEVRNRLEHLVNEVLRDGIIDIPKDEVESNEITIRNLRDRTERVLNLANVRDIEEVEEFVAFRLRRMFREEAAGMAIALFNSAVQPNFNFSESQTSERISEAIEGISLTKGAVTAGEVIIRRGDLITEERLNRLRSLEAARATRASNIEIFLRYFGNALLIFSMFMTFLIYLYLYRKPIYDDNSRFVLVFLALGLLLGVGAFLSRLDTISDYIVPLALAPILLTIIFDSRVGLMSTLTIAMIMGVMNGYSFEFTTATIVASSMGVYTVRDVRKRSQFFLTTPGLILFSYFIVLLGFTLARTSNWALLGENMVNVLFNVVLISILTYPLLFLFEKLFKVTTDVTLYELNDNNSALLKALLMRAPGSFQHSIQVANLTESAASAIGANAILARVGALYHDIGKMNKPHYFVENQSGMENVHEKLKPRMSALVIKNHVDDGVSIAEEENLPPVIIDFIRTHHGNSLIKFFYSKALEEAEDDKSISEADFRYDGPLPETKETGILLLADCIEAASRSLSEPSFSKLENLVNRLVEERLAEGQLDNCPLTFRDLTIIKAEFLKILTSMYHGRIKYPGQAEAEKKEESDSKAAEAQKAGTNDTPAESNSEQEKPAKQQQENQKSE